MMINKKDWYGIIIISVSFLVSLCGIFLFPYCNGSPFDCIISRENLLSDFYWHYNTIKDVAETGILPAKVEISPGVTRPVWHGPLYYYLSAGVYLFAQVINLNDIILLHIFSAVITLFTNFIFFLLLKKLSKYFKSKYFMIYSLSFFVFLPTALHLSLFIHPVVLFYFFFIISFYAYVRFIEEKNIKNAVILGILAGLGMLASLNAIIIPITIFVFLVIKHFKREYQERNLILISFCIPVLLSLFSLMRNYLLFNNFFGDMHTSPYHKTLIKMITHTFTAFWGGIFGGIKLLYFPIGFIALTISLSAILGIVYFYYKKRQQDTGLYFLMLINLINTVIFINWGCGIVNFIKTLGCVGEGIQNKYLAPFIPLIAIFSTMCLLKLQEKKYLKKIIWVFISVSCILFVIDFIWALV